MIGALLSMKPGTIDHQKSKKASETEIFGLQHFGSVSTAPRVPQPPGSIRIQFPALIQKSAIIGSDIGIAYFIQNNDVTKHWMKCLVWRYD